MILFAADWDDYPSAIVDERTTNHTFIRYTALLKAMGIKNHLFPLALHNPDLQGIEPHDPSLDALTKAAILAECWENPWYYFREVAKAPPRSGVVPEPFEASRLNIALLWLYFCHITGISVAIRQVGKTFAFRQLIIYLLNVRLNNGTINLLTLSEGHLSDNVDLLKKIEQLLPSYIRRRTSKDPANTDNFVVSARGNKLLMHLPPKSPRFAKDTGRGFTSENSIIDEFSSLPNIDLILPVLLASGNAARDIARANDEPYGTILTLNAGDPEDPSGAYAFETVQQAAPWSEGFFDCQDLTDLEATVMRNSASNDLMVNCSWNHRQLGKDDAWLRRVAKETRSVGVELLRGLLGIWTSGGGSCPIPPEDQKKITDSIQNYYTGITPKFGLIVRWHVPLKDLPRIYRERSLVMTIDPSEAIGRDDISVTIADVLTGATVAAGNYPRINLWNFSEWLAEWFVEFPKLVGVIERKSSGISIIDNLCILLPAKGIDPFERLFNWIVQEKHRYPDRYKLLRTPLAQRNQGFYDQRKEYFGFATAGTGPQSRQTLYGEVLFEACKRIGILVKDPIIAQQLLSLVNRNGRVDHPPNGKDDSAIGWCLWYWFITRGRNLDHYGIRPMDILAELTDEESEEAPLTYLERGEQEALQEEIDATVERLGAARDSFMIQRLELELRQMHGRLKRTANTAYAFDQLIDKARKLREQHRRDLPSPLTYRRD